MLANGGGLVAFDVGVGKTYTGIAILARARQEGWCKRPVILVPNSIVWKWYADIRRVLPDYQIGVVGSKQKVISRGPRKGVLTSESDTPQNAPRSGPASRPASSTWCC
ncbi:MAG: DEAD/DEAH box helicase family protein [Deltaproteobacteria bacterium]|nr:DEAD/DEAH box helicase family protein [Deltaproteobacteria bacterium]